MTPLEERAAAWKPEEITLESAALYAVKSRTNTLIVAGPGAGKTELLAQRACFLLETGSCPSPFRILAISFKREAAENLKARVILRCGRESAARFDSLTYDAFAKDLLDRFRLSLPAATRPSADYEVMTGNEVSDARLREKFLELPIEQCPLDRYARQGITGTALVREGMLAQSLPVEEWPHSPQFIAGASMWRAMIDERPSRLSFPMIGRLAEYVVRGNRRILAALRDTYQFVFLDEFQDTTAIQFALTTACFRDSPAVLTAVGDTKQKIMGFAGALTGIFRRFEESFGAKVIKLTQNHRSRSKLVAIQSIFATELDPDSVAVSAMRSGETVGECRVLEFDDETREAEYLADVVVHAVESEQVPAEEICVLCRAKPDSFARALNVALKERGIKALVEVNRREIIGEPVSALLLDVVTLIFADSAPKEWENVSAIMAELAGDRDEHEAARTMHSLVAFLGDFQKKLLEVTAGKEEVCRFLHECLNFLGGDRFAVFYPQYAQGDYLDGVVEQLAELIVAELPAAGWDGVVDAVKGVGAVSVMTMHKSKGLEFHTVIFLGLEDDALWNYKRNADEETCGLFVALSRAKERCIFTFCRSRTGKYGVPTMQSRLTIKRIFELFSAAGVEIEEIR